MKLFSLDKIVNSRAFLIALPVATAAFSSAAGMLGDAPSPAPTSGFLFDGAEGWLEPGIVSWGANAAAIAIAAVFLYALNKTFSFIRDFTLIHTTIFLTATFLNPVLSRSLCASTLLAATLAASAIVLFLNFQRGDRRSSLFLIAAALSTGSMACYQCIYYLPLFVIGMIQMRAFSFRGLLAVAVGVATPYWLAVAFGLADLSALRMPEFATIATEYPSLSNANGVHIACIALIGTVFGMASVLKIISYRLELRAYNGFLNLMAVYTLLLMAVDTAHIDSYVATLNMLMAVQAAHFFTIHRVPQAGLLFLALLAADVALSEAVALNLF